MSTGTTADYTCTRDKLIEMALKVIGILEPGQSISGEDLQDGNELLSMLIRETDESGRWRWTIGAASHLTLAANTCVYDSSNGLPTNIAELLTVAYRDSAGRDSPPLRILKAETYETITDKVRTGSPTAVYLTEDITLASRRLYIWPMLSAIATGSVVTGTDAAAYKCIIPHTGATVNRPTTGANWRMYWEAGGSGAVAWAADTVYTNTEQLRLTFRRPIYDFDSASDTPDFPLQWPRLLMYKLAFDLGDLYGIPESERDRMIKKAKGSFDDIFQSVKARSNTRHNKVTFY